jgi:LysR family transcriptional regulator (chromosome initiation inhibitor)
LQGCDSRALGEMRYVASATPAFVAQHFSDGITSATLSRAPALTFSVKDTYQSAWVRKVTGRHVTLPSHWLPSSHGFVDACLAGLGWCMHPLAMGKPHLDAGRLVELVPGSHMDVPLYWQWNRIVSGALKGLNKAVTEAARARMNP